jgi:hypothetical protein
VLTRPRLTRQMREFAVLERPYARSELERALVIAGLPCYEFVGTIDGWFCPRDSVAQNADQLLSSSAGMMNLTVCAKSGRALARLFPHRRAIGAQQFGRDFFENENTSCPSASELMTENKTINL